MANLNRILADIQKEYGRKVARAFADAIADIKNGVDYTAFVRAIESGNIQAALDVLDIDNAVFASMRSSIGEAYSLGGSAVVVAVQAAAPVATRAVVRWDAANPVAEGFLRTELGTRITRITQDTLEAVRERMTAGYARGEGPRTIGTAIVGKVGPNGRRVGGVVGLNMPQVRTMAAMREALSDPSTYGRFFVGGRNRWQGANHNTTRTIAKAMREGKTLTAAQINKILSANEAKMLRQRGDTIARTETANAVEQARIDGVRVDMQKRNYPAQYATKEWLHGGGGMTPREQHVMQSRTIAEGLDTPFIMEDGTLMQRPLDPNSSAKHTINCTCTVQINIDYVRLRRDGLI